MGVERLTVQVSEVGARSVATNLILIGSSANSSTKAVKTLTAALGFTTLAIGLKNSLGVLSEFGQNMSMVRAASEGTEQQFTALVEKAKEVGRTSRYSAIEASEAMMHLAKAGFTVREVMGSVTPMLNLALAGMMDLGQASDIVVGSVRSFHLEISELTRVTDVLAKAALASVTDVKDIGEAFKYVAPVAAGMKMTIEETAAAVAVLSNANIRGTTAGTGLKVMLATLEAPTASDIRVFTKLGFTEEQATITAHKFGEVLKKLAESGASVGDEMRLFGQRGGVAGQAIGSSIPQYERFKEMLEGSGGTCAKVAGIMDNNLNGAMKRLHAVTQNIILGFADVKESGLQLAIDTLTESVRFLEKNMWLLEGVLLMLAVRTLPLVVTGIKAIIVAIAVNPTTFLWVMMGTAISALIMRLIDLKGGLTQLGYDVYSTFRDITITLARCVDFILGALGGLVNGAAAALGALPAVLGHYFISAFNFILNGVQGLLDGIVRAINAFLETAEARLITLQSIGQSIGINIGTANLGRIVSPTIGNLKDPFKVGFGDLGEASAKAFSDTFKSSIIAEFYGKSLPEMKPPEFPKPVYEFEEEYGPPGAMKGPEVTGGWTIAGHFEDEFKKGRDNIIREIGDISSALTSTLGGALNSATGAFADFAMSGFRSVKALRTAFSDMFASVAKGILQMVMNMMLLEAIGGIFPSATQPGGMLAKILGTPAAKQVGGPVGAGMPYMVGEKGPELFVPRTSGNIVPASQAAGGQPVYLRIVNVRNEDEIPAGMATGAGERVILNTVMRNKKLILAGA